MLVHPEFDPIIFQAGPLAVRWYGLMYLCGFIVFWLLGRYRARKSGSFIQPDQVGDFLFYAVLGVVLVEELAQFYFIILTASSKTRFTYLKFGKAE